MKEKQKLTNKDFEDASLILKCEAEVIKAVCQIEAPKGGFNEDGTPITLFEGHWFHKFTNGKYDWDFPRVFENEDYTEYTNLIISHPKWTRKYYGKNQKEEKVRLKYATSLNRNAALMSASWGKFQIMGFNFAICGFKTVQQFVNAMYKSEEKQLEVFCNYIINTGLDDELQNKEWDKFAYKYNGPLYKKNRYAWRLEKAYNKLIKENKKIYEKK